MLKKALDYSDFRHV